MADLLDQMWNDVSVATPQAQQRKDMLDQVWEEAPGAVLDLTEKPTEDFPEELQDQADRMRNTTHYTRLFGISVDDAYDYEKELNEALYGKGISSTKAARLNQENAHKYEKIGFWESFLDNPEKFIPVWGTLKDIGNYASVLSAAQRLQANEYGKPVTERPYAAPFGGPYAVPGYKPPARPPAPTREEDQAVVNAWLEDWYEKSVRGYTFGGKAGQIMGEVPAFIGDMLISRGLYTGVKAGVGSFLKTLGKEALEGQAKRALLKNGVKQLAGWAIASGIRAGVGTPHRVLETYLQTRLPENVQLDADGQMIFTWPDDSPTTSLLKAWGDVAIELASEEAGETLMKGLTVGAGALSQALSKTTLGKQVLPILYRGYTSIHGAMPYSEFVKTAMSKGGWHGIVGEIGEEYLGDAMRAVVAVDDFGAGPDANVFQRLEAAMVNDIKNTPIMFASFLPMEIGGRIVSGGEGKGPYGPEAMAQAEKVLAGAQVTQKQAAATALSQAISEDIQATQVKLGQVEMGQPTTEAPAAGVPAEGAAAGVEAGTVTVYTGSDEPFTAFDLSKLGTRTDAGFAGRGAYTTTDLEKAKRWGKHVMSTTITGGKWIEITKLSDLDQYGLQHVQDTASKSQEQIQKEHAALVNDFAAKMAEQGYDGVKWKMSSGDTQVVLFHPEQYGFQPVSPTGVEAAKQPWDMTQEEIVLSKDYPYVVRQLPGEDIARVESDGTISLDPDKFWGHSKESRRDILSHEIAHLIEADIPSDVKASLFDNPTVMAYRGRNINEKLANMIAEGIPVPQEIGRSWAKDSKIRDAEGRVPMLYHGTTAPSFSLFATPTWFTSELATASDYAEGGRIETAYLNIKNPFWASINGIVASDIAALKSQGYDGILYRNEAGAVWATAFYPHQILRVEAAPEVSPYLTNAAGEPQVFYHGTKGEFADTEIAEGKGILRHGIYLAHEEGAAKLYGKVKQYVIRARTEEVLDLSDGDMLWQYMKDNEILDEEELQDTDLENYVRNGRIFQYDISSNTHLADYVIAAAKEQGYKVVRLADDLGGFSDNIATVVTSPDVLVPTATLPSPEAAPEVTPEAQSPQTRPGQQFSSVKAGDVVDGLTVRSGPVPNTDSISAELGDDWEEIGLREIPVSVFTGESGEKTRYSVEGKRAVRNLKTQIEESGEITPLIVVEDKDGYYILEGATRADALSDMGKKSFPALLIRDISEKSGYDPEAEPATVTEVTPAAPQPAAQPTPSQWGAANTGVTLAQYQAIKARMAKGKLPGGRSAGGTIFFDPESWSDAIAIARFHFEAGARSLADWTSHMLDDFNDTIKPHLAALWRAAQGEEVAPPQREELELTTEGPSEPPNMDTLLQSSKGPLPELTSAKQASIREDRASMDLAGVNSASRRTFAEDLQKAREQGIPDNAVLLASEILVNPRALSDVETAGFVLRMVAIKNQYSNLSQQIERSQYDAVTKELANLMDRLEADFDVLSDALYRSGSEKGRALAAQKLTLDQDMSLVSVKRRAKAAKGAALTPAESAKFTQMVEQLEAKSIEVATLEKEVAALKARRIAKSAKSASSRYSKMSTEQIRSERPRLINRVAELMKAGCYDA